MIGEGDPSRVTSPTWAAPLPGKQVLRRTNNAGLERVHLSCRHHYHNDDHNPKYTHSYSHNQSQSLSQGSSDPF